MFAFVRLKKNTLVWGIFFSRGAKKKKKMHWLPSLVALLAATTVGIDEVWRSSVINMQVDKCVFVMWECSAYAQCPPFVSCSGEKQCRGFQTTFIAKNSSRTCIVRSSDRWENGSIVPIVFNDQTQSCHVNASLFQSTSLCFHTLFILVLMNFINAIFF